MAVVDWPWDLAKILWDGYGHSRVPRAERTPLADGFVRQEQRVSLRQEIRSVTVVVKLSNLAAFQAWLREHGNGFVNFHDLEEPDKEKVRDVRIVGGDIDLVAASDSLLDGERYFRGQASLEGYW